ncbi:unnamed protein product [Dicrocoelium dendriticum]|nr:unnamed protein product [Dicrocoelium dendriticum]
MNISKAVRSCIDVVFCGISAATLDVLEAASSLESCIKISGYWDVDYPGKSSLRPIGVQILSSSFDDLLKSAQYDFIFLCLSPQMQYKVLRSSLLKLEVMVPPTSKSTFPAVILFPPVSPCYNCIALSDARNFIGVAMPFRRLTSVATLCAHLRSNLETSSLNSTKCPSSLPSKWTLGALRSFHVRLRAVNPVKADEYSWLCEPGAIGGGLLNIYASSLIDLAFLLTSGLRINSVSCLCRTFDTEVSTNSDSIRRISAEDYVLATAEMESRCGTSRGPVAVFCLAADLPRTSSEYANPKNLSYHSHNDQFILEIEIVGSSGRFIISSCHDEVQWNPVGRVIGPTNLEESIQTDVCSTPVDNPGSHFQPRSGEGLTVTNGSLRENEKQLDTHILRCKTNGCHIPDMGNSSTTQHHKTSKPNETSVDKIPDQCSHKPLSTKASSQVREMWKHWFTELSSAMRGSSTRQSLESFVATPEHWGYIQRVLMALDKAARMRCWVDVATGERV